jgi:hypothetical protein
MATKTARLFRDSWWTVLRRTGISGWGVWSCADLGSTRELWAGGISSHADGCVIRGNHRCPVWVYGRFSWCFVARGSRSARFRKTALLRAAEECGVPGATYPLALTVFGWGPFQNLASVLPISIVTGVICGIVLTREVQEYVLAVPSKRGFETEPNRKARFFP